LIYLRYLDLEIELRSPDLQNPEDHVLGVQRRFDMAGRPHTWVPPKTDSKVHTLTCRAMSRETMYALRDFLLTSAGQEITYIDASSNSWIGRITSNLQTIIGGMACNDSITLQFEGVRGA
jgi:hypothetical protein